MAQYKGAAAEGVRANQLIKRRQKEQEELEVRKKKIEEDLKIGSITNKFAAHYDAIEQKLKSDTVGLVSLEEMRAKQDSVIKARETQLAVDIKATYLQSDRKREKKHKNKKKEATSVLSFSMDADDDEEAGSTEEDEDEEREVVTKKKRLGMNPDVDTSFLPDRDREEAEAKIREELRIEWEEKQAKIKSEEIEITYSYWDGSGHRRSIKMKKGNSIQQFLQMALEKLRKEFNELKLSTVDQLMYVKEDLMIPHHYTFYDFIVTKARGKSGPLFSFDVHDDVRIISDANVEKDESHAGKVCLRSWYERNKHIFPASRWEPYNPEKKWDSYSVSDKEAAKIIVK